MFHAPSGAQALFTPLLSAANSGAMDQQEQGLLLEQLQTLACAAGGWLRTRLDAASEAVAQASSSAVRKVSAPAAEFNTCCLLLYSKPSRDTPAVAPAESMPAGDGGGGGGDGARGGFRVR